MKKIKIIYFVLFLIGIFLVSSTYFSYAFFTSKNEEHGKLNIVAGTLDYKIESEDLINNNITIDKKTVKELVVKITSLNEIISIGLSVN